MTKPTPKLVLKKKRYQPLFGIGADLSGRTPNEPPGLCSADVVELDNRIAIGRTDVRHLGLQRKVRAPPGSLAQKGYNSLASSTNCPAPGPQKKVLERFKV